MTTGGVHVFEHARKDVIGEAVEDACRGREVGVGNGDAEVNDGAADEMLILRAYLYRILYPVALQSPDTNDLTLGVGIVRISVFDEGESHADGQTNVCGMEDP